MDYLNNIVSQNTPIQNAVKLIKQFPVSHKLTDMYKRSSRNEVLFVGAATFLTLYNLSTYLKSKHQKYNLPPTIPYSLPFFGHTLYLMLMPSKFLDWCNKNYGEVYNIVHRGEIVTMTSGKAAEEAFRTKNTVLSLEEGIVKDVLHLDYVIEEKTLDIGNHVNPGIAKMVIPSSKMPNFVNSIQTGLENACRAMLTEKSTTFKDPNVFLQNFVAYMSVPGIVGEEFALNVELLESFASFTGDVVKNVGLLMLVPNFLHRFILPYIQSAKKHEEVMLKHIVPFIHERREKMRLAKEAGKEHGFTPNFLQGLIEYTGIDENGNEFQYNPEQLSKSILMIAFASVHTTSKNLSHSIVWLIARPDLKARLLEEIERVLPNNAPPTTKSLAEMKFLNNFTREILRQGADKVSAGKKALVDFTFSNGYQVPKGRVVGFNMRQVNFGDNFNRGSVEGMDPDMNLNKLCTTPARDFLTFGAGKHICPGRFFAVQEIQMSLIFFLRNYDITTPDGKCPPPINYIAGYMSTTYDGPLTFTRKN